MCNCNGWLGVKHQLTTTTLCSAAMEPLICYTISLHASRQLYQPVQPNCLFHATLLFLHVCMSGEINVLIKCVLGWEWERDNSDLVYDFFKIFCCCCFTCFQHGNSLLKKLCILIPLKHDRLVTKVCHVIHNFVKYRLVRFYASNFQTCQYFQYYDVVSWVLILLTMDTINQEDNIELYLNHYDDDELMLNVLRCQLTY